MAPKKSLFFLGLLLFFFCIGIKINAQDKFNLPVRVIAGEIVYITPQKIKIEIEGIYFQFPFGPKPRFFCNGGEASWNALTPVTSEAFFEAEIGLDSFNRVIFVNGRYTGEECVVEGWAIIANQLSLELFLPEKDCYRTRLVKKNAHLPEAEWLKRYQVIYVVYNQKAEIRAIFLPD